MPRPTRATASGCSADWTLEIGNFWQICPREMISRLEHPLSDEEKAEIA